MTAPPSTTFQAFLAHIQELQNRIGDAWATLDDAPFETKEWQRAEGGGGRMGFLRGRTIEKGACHVSHVYGDSNPLTDAPFRACGLSLILHPVNPHVPTVHMNVRRFEEPERSWWGGGIDLTPLGVHHDDDARRFHDTLRAGLGDRYHEGKRSADEYFHVPHRGQPRGAGGVFYDHMDTGDQEADRRFIQRIGELFFEAYLPILTRRKDTPFDDELRHQQAIDRGLYVEFNLLYDRGTRFGLQSAGNPEAILSSLPPEVRWP